MRPFVVRVPKEQREVADKLLVGMTEFAATRLRSLYEKFIASGRLQRYADDWNTRAIDSSAVPLARAGALISRALMEMGYPEVGHEHDGRGEVLDAIAPTLSPDKHTRPLLREMDDYEAALRVIGLSPGRHLSLAVNFVVAPARLLLSPEDAELQRLIEEEERAAATAVPAPEPVAPVTPVPVPLSAPAKKWRLLHVENPGSPTPRGDAIEATDSELAGLLTKFIAEHHPDLPIPAASAARAIRHYLVETPADIKRVMSKEAVGPVAYHKLKRGGARIYVRERDGGPPLVDAAPARLD